MNTECCTCHRPAASLEEELAFDLDVAKRAMGAGDFVHARHHLAGAFGAAPTNSQTQSCFEALAAKCDLAVESPSRYYGDMAVTAWAYQRAGDRNSAVRF